MKLLTTPIILLIAIRFCTFASAPDSKSYHWVRAINPGVKTWPRWVVPVAGPDENLRMIDKGETWLSTDGINWTTVRNNAAQAVRPGAAQTFFGGKFWLIGGMNSWAEFTNEVWSSSDGVNWTMVAEHAPWSARRNALLVEFDRKLWLLGGAESSGKRDVTPTRFFNDVWQSSDGVEWRQVSANMPASREQVLVFKDRMWLLGAGGGWSSSDGQTWHQTTSGAPLSNLRAYGAVVFDGRMWIFGGLDPEKTTNQAWSSNDGVTWQEAKRAPWFPRGAKYSTVFNGKLWIYGGKTGITYEQADDVWFMTPEKYK